MDPCAPAPCAKYPTDGDRPHSHATGAPPAHLSCPVPSTEAPLTGTHRIIHPGTLTMTRVISPPWLPPQWSISHAPDARHRGYISDPPASPTQSGERTCPVIGHPGPPALMQARCAPSSGLVDPTRVRESSGRRAHATRQNPPRSQRVGSPPGFLSKELVSLHAEPSF